jgi:hypothetical protein
MHPLRSVALSSLLLALAALSGCGPSMGQIDGKVVWTDGSPATELAGGQVIFESQEMRITARGEIGPDGSFTLRTSQEGDGARVGEYEVAIVEHRVSTGGEGGPLSPQRLPNKYYDFKTSGLKATVKPGRSPVTLTVEPLKPPKK